jgi:hypothetical protein
MVESMQKWFLHARSCYLTVGVGFTRTALGFAESLRKVKNPFVSIIVAQRVGRANNPLDFQKSLQ